MTAQPLAQDLADLSNPMVMHLADMIASRLAAPVAATTMTFGELYELYYERRVKPRLKNTQNAHYFFKAHGPRWAGMMVHEIKRPDVQAWVDDLGKKSPSAATRALDMLKSIINWGIKREFIPPITNPCNGVETFELHSRERFILPSELIKFEEALQAEPPLYRDIFHICLLTGARRGNVCSMRWEEIDFDLGTWTIPAAKFKNGNTLVVPLTTWPLAILQRRKAAARNLDWVFPGKSKGKSGHVICVRKPWKRVIKRAGLSDLRVHDLRRTLASYMAIDGNNAYTIARMLGHKDPRSTAVYARLDVKAVRKAAEAVSGKWQDFLALPVEISTNHLTISLEAEAGTSVFKNSQVHLTPAQQIIVESKILTCLTQFRRDTKSHFYSKIGCQVPINSSELERVLTSMQERGLIECSLDDRAVQRYALINGGTKAS